MHYSFFKQEFLKGVQSEYEASNKGQKIQQPQSVINKSGFQKDGRIEKQDKIGLFEILTSKQGYEIAQNYLNSKIRSSLGIGGKHGSAATPPFYSQLKPFDSGEFKNTLINSNNQQLQSTTMNSNEQISVLNIEGIDEFKLTTILSEIFSNVSEQAMFDITDTLLANPSSSFAFSEIYLIILFGAAIEGNKQLEFLNMFGRHAFDIFKNSSNMLYGSRFRQISKLIGYSERMIFQTMQTIGITPDNQYSFDMFEVYFFALFQMELKKTQSMNNNNTNHMHPNNSQQSNYPQQNYPQSQLHLSAKQDLPSCSIF